MAKKAKKFYRRYSPLKKYRRFRKGKAPVPILPLLGGVVTPLITSWETAGGLGALQNNSEEFAMGMLDQVVQRYTGFHAFGKYGTGFNTKYVMETYGGLLAGQAGHMIANAVGINKTMKRVPYVGKYVQL